MASPKIDRTGVDPSITDEDIERAIDGTPAAFPDVDADAQDDLEEDEPRGLVSVVAASIPQRIANARGLRENRVFVGVGMCHKTVRGPILGLPAVYPTAAVAGAHSKPAHRLATPGAPAPRGAIGFAFNGGAGHTWLELSPVKVSGRPDTLVSTTDFHENGYEGVALRSRMLSWCGAISWIWGESDNGFDVWPDAKPKPPPPDHEFHTWPWKRRVEFLRNDAKREAKAHPHMAHQLRAWADRIEKNHQ